MEKGRTASLDDGNANEEDTDSGHAGDHYDGGTWNKRPREKGCILQERRQQTDSSLRDQGSYEELENDVDEWLL
jgi:hypothetical protein